LGGEPGTKGVPAVVTAERIPSADELAARGVFAERRVVLVEATACAVGATSNAKFFVIEVRPPRQNRIFDRQVDGGHEYAELRGKLDAGLVPHHVATVWIALADEARTIGVFAAATNVRGKEAVAKSA
jgi:hypothetical protein